MATGPIIFPWPPSVLAGHAKGRSYYTKAAATAKTRAEAAMIARPVVKDYLTPETGDIALIVTFLPPNNRQDRWNMPQLAKATADGLADAMGVNDKRFLPRFEFGAVVKGGQIVVEIL